jgi:hypothetical protein
MLYDLAAADVRSLSPYCRLEHFACDYDVLEFRRWFVPFKHATNTCSSVAHRLEITAVSRNLCLKFILR